MDSDLHPDAMELKELLKDDGAVSPVIGVILMVAITVILAAVIAAFVLGLGDTSSVGPQVSFDYDFDEEADDLTIKVSSGDSFTAERVSFTGENLGGNSGDTWADETTTSGLGDESTVGAGERATLDLSSASSPDEFELEIVWTSEEGGDSNIISTRTGPDA